MAVAVVPVPQALPGLLAPVAEERRRPTSLLVVGGVDYGAGKPWLALPGTVAEAEAVQASFGKLHRHGEAIALRGGLATKKAVREAMAKVRCAHLATHGFFSTQEERSGDGPRSARGAS